MAISYGFHNSTATMKTCSTLLLLLLVAATVTTTTTAQVTNFYCLGNTTYTANSPFSTNLQTALTTLSAASSTAKSSNTTVSSTLYALYFCRYDLPLSTCHECVSNATTYIVTLCPTSTEAVIWYEHCTLRYNTRPLYLPEHPSPYYWTWGGRKLFLQVPDFNKTLVATLKTAIDQAVVAANNKTMRYFATGEGVYGKYQKVRCLVQCEPDISAGDCRICLEAALNLTEIYSLGASWGMVFRSPCTMRFGVAPFYALGNSSDGAVSPTASISWGSRSSAGGSASSSSAVHGSHQYGIGTRTVISGTLLLLYFVLI